MFPCNVFHRLIAKNNRIYILGNYLTRYRCDGIHTSRYLTDEARPKKKRRDNLDFNKIFSNEDDKSTASAENSEPNEKHAGQFYRPNAYDQYSSFARGNTEAWDQQPNIVIFCMIAFFIYLFYFKEETYLDRVLEKPLNELVPGLEEATLIANMNEGKRRGLDTTAVEKRLCELRAAKAKDS